MRIILQVQIDLLLLVATNCESMPHCNYLCPLYFVLQEQTCVSKTAGVLVPTGGLNVHAMNASRL